MCQCKRGNVRGYLATHWNNSMIVVFAVSRTPLSASSSAATSDGTCARNKMLCSLVICKRTCELYVNLTDSDETHSSQPYHTHLPGSRILANQSSSKDMCFHVLRGCNP